MFWQTPVRTQRAQNRHRDDDSTRPGRHFINVEEEPVRQKHQLRWNRWNELPTYRANKRQVEANVGICMLKTAEAMNCLPRGRKMWRVRIVPGKLQGEVCFASGVEFRRATGIEIPAAVRQLLAAHVVRQF